MCSTIPRAELLAGGGPIGVLEENEDKTPIELMSPSHRFDEDIGSIGPINVSMIYLLSPTGEVTFCSYHMPSPYTILLDSC